MFDFILRIWSVGAIPTTDSLITQVYSCKPHPTKVPHPHAKQVFMCNYVTGSAGMTCQHNGADKQYYVVLIVAQCCCRDV